MAINVAAARLLMIITRLNTFTVTINKNDSVSETRYSATWNHE